MKVLRARDYKRMPWKNGGGETVEIAVFPQDAGLADFDWRISMATVASDGPFSVFPGIDRTLSILDGAGMTLFIGDREPAFLDRDSAPLPFAADTPTSATLVNGPITDLNVMTKRDTLSHAVSRTAIDGTLHLALNAATTLLLCHNGSLDILVGSEKSSLSARDCLVADQCSGDKITISGKGSFFLIRLLKI
jgi:hypothetical protein